MQKIRAAAIFAMLALLGCSVPGNVAVTDNRCLDGDRVLKETLGNNITDYGFYVQKGRLVITEGSKKTRLLFFMRYSRDDNYLVSIRSAAGFEAIRMLITRDTLLINDRINRELLFGNPEDFTRITGVSVDLLKICVGDLAGKDFKVINDENTRWKNIKVLSYTDNVTLSSEIDCRTSKVARVSLVTFDGSGLLDVSYSSFKGTGLRVPGRTEIIDGNRNVNIRIEIRKFIIPWYGELEFYPAAGFIKKRI